MKAKLNILYMRVQAVFMEIQKNSHYLKILIAMNPFSCMQLQKNLMK